MVAEDGLFFTDWARLLGILANPIRNNVLASYGASVSGSSVTLVS